MADSTSHPGPAWEKGYFIFMDRKKAVLDKTDLDGVRTWYNKRIDAMSDMDINAAPLTGSGGWAEERTEDGEHVNRIVGKFFTVEGRQVEMKNPDDSTAKTWNQPGIIQTEIPVTLPTPDGDIHMKVSDLVGIIKDREGNVLLTVKQGVFAKTEKNAKVCSPFQTSSAKAKGILEKGQAELDPIFSETVAVLGAGQTLEEMFASGELEIFPLGEADENRIDATNVGFVTTVVDPTVHEKLRAGGKNRWCAPDEVKALARAGLINGHTAAALLAA